MGFDLSGMAPCHPEGVICEKPSGAPWDKDGNEEDWKAYWAWVQNTPGVYFRNNVWFWRPLWVYICTECDDILSEEDMQSGEYNDFHEISKSKAIKIADRLEELLRNGEVETYAETHKRLAEESRNSEDSEERFMSTYTFSVSNVEEFAEFARFSGGFTIG